MDHPEIFEPLDKWPDGVVDFPESLQGKIRYDPEKKRLVLVDALLKEELEQLLKMSSDPAFVGAVKRLDARYNELLGNLRFKEEDDSGFVTEKIAGMKRYVHIFLLLWFVALGGGAIYVLIYHWPEPRLLPDGRSQAVDSEKTGPADSARSERNDVTDAAGNPLSQRLIMSLVLAAGVLGRSLVGLTSLVWFRAHRRLFKSWTLWYFAQPLIAGMLAEVFYIVVRAGFLTPNSTVNLYGVVAISGLVGMFTREAMDKLSDVFKTLFASKTGETNEGKAVTTKTVEENGPQPRAE
ncbi:MAG: hypothetical protein HW407_964 [Bacteroidetes bacterium]|nr:hypothetical protein [Bacteroidota bacterium]